MDRPALHTAIYQHESNPAEGAEARLERLGRALSESGGGLDIVLCPELFLSGYNVGELLAARSEPTDGPALQGLAELARKHGTAIVAGYPEKAEGRRYNSACAIGPDGSFLLNHRKIALPSDYEKAHFEPEAGYGFFELKGWRLSLLICYDVEFPEAVRAAALGGAEIVLAPTALRDVWDVVAEKLIPARAFENGVYLLYANYAGSEGDLSYFGGSRIVGPDGRERATAGRGEELIRAELTLEPLLQARETLPYLTDHARYLT